MYLKFSRPGVSDDKPIEGASYAGKAEPVVASLLVENRAVTFGVAIPLPYPMSAEVATKESIEVIIDRVEGLPEEFELLATLPRIKRTFPTSAR